MSIPKSVLSSFLLALGYAIAFYLVQLLLFRMGCVNTFPDAQNLLNWDANWYHSIVKDGYLYWNGANSNSGFFILFPFIWKMLRLNPWGISFLNLLFFSAAFAIITGIYKPDIRTKFVWLTIPSLYFAWVPYTEALFMLLVALSFIGILHKRRFLVWISLFLLALTRPVTLVLLPALLIMELMSHDKKDWLDSVKYYVVNYALPLCSGLALFIWYQYHVTGVAFAYFIQQRENWGHKFAIPTLPFDSQFGLRLLWLNAAALFLGLVTLLVLIKYGWQWLRKNIVHTDKLLVLSCLYFTGISLTTILFNPTWGTNTTNVFDIHRYAFVSPFFWVLLYRFTVVNKYRPIDYAKLFLLSNIFWLTFAHYRDAGYFLYFNGISVLVILYMLLSEKRVSWMPWVVTVINFCFQVLLFQWFLNGVYPG